MYLPAVLLTSCSWMHGLSLCSHCLHFTDLKSVPDSVPDSQQGYREAKANFFLPKITFYSRRKQDSGILPRVHAPGKKQKQSQECRVTSEKTIQAEQPNTVERERESKRQSEHMEHIYGKVKGVVWCNINFPLILDTVNSQDMFDVWHLLL